MSETAEMLDVLIDALSSKRRELETVKAEPTASLREKATAGSDNEGA